MNHYRPVENDGGDNRTSFMRTGEERIGVMATSNWQVSIRSARFMMAVLAAVLLVLAWAHPAWATGANFDNLRHYPVGRMPTTVTSADFDNDGNVDLVAQNAADASVSVYMGTVSGRFERRREFAVGSVPAAVDSADLDGDSKPDLAVANQGDGSVSILKGKGDGTFEPFGGSNRDVPAGPGPSSVSIADLNGDGKADLAVANLNSSTVTVLLGNGDGGFQSVGFSKIDELPRCPSLICAQYPMLAPNQVITGDFNADSRVDLATANMGGPCGGLVITCHPGGVSVLLGRGDGTLQPAITYPLGTSRNGLAVSLSVAAADLTADGIADLATTVEHANTVRVLRGSGAGTFSSGAELPVGSRPSAVTGADLDEDGKSDDLAVTNFGSDNVSILLNDAGNFQAARNFPAGDGPIFVKAANFNDDNDDGTIDRSDSEDLAVANQNSNSVSVLGPPVPDETAPATTHSVSPQPNAAGWNRDEVTVTLTATDTGSGVREISYELNGGATTTVPGDTARIPVRDDGETTVVYRATDQAGNTGTSRSVTVKVDRTAPRITPEDVVNRVWRHEPLSDTFTSTDDGSGLANGPDASFTLTASNQSASGSQPTVVSRTVSDVAGNSTVRRVSALIDLTAPRTTASATPQLNAAGWSSRDVTLSLSAVDTLSTVREIHYWTNPGGPRIPETVYDPQNPPTISAEGTTTVTYFAFDEAGNREDPKTLEVKIDKSAPTLDTDSSDGSDGITPDNRATGIDRSISPTATFSDEMDAVSLDGSAKLYAWNVKKKTWKPVPIAVSVEGRTVTLDPHPADPRRMLAAGTKHKVTVTTGAENLAGIRMGQIKNWTFTTRR
jgi:hypothetical protein